MLDMMGPRFMNRLAREMKEDSDPGLKSQIEFESLNRIARKAQKTQTPKQLEKQLNKELLKMRKSNEASDFRGEWFRVKLLKTKNELTQFKLISGRNAETYDEFDLLMKRLGFTFGDIIERGKTCGMYFTKNGMTYEFLQRMLS